jgi:hypothetical protein
MSGFVLRNPVITIGGTSYTGQLTRARLVPEVNRQTGKTLDPDTVYQDVDEPVWTLQLTGYQGWENGTGIADYLNDNHGLSVAVVLTPRPGTGNTSAAFNVIAQTVDFGGEQGAWTTFEAELGVVNQPVFSVVGP